MKRIISKIVIAAAMLVSINFSAKAEKIDNLIKEGVVYYGDEKEVEGVPGKFFRMVKWFSGNVDINGKTFYKLWSNISVYTEEERYRVPDEGELLALLRYDEGKIYAFTLGRQGIQDEVLIYDASLTVGESCEVYSAYRLNFEFRNEDMSLSPSHFPLKCFATATVTSCGNDFDLVYVNIDHYVDEYTDEDIKDELEGKGMYPHWIKGAGSELVFEGSENNVYGMSGGFYYALESIFCDGVKVFDSNDITNMRNIQTSAVNGIEAEAEESTAPKYHPDGTRFADGEKGIYIQSGKKRVAL